MDLQGQEEDDQVIELGNNNKNDGSQTDETSEQSQEPNDTDTQMKTSSSLKESAMAAKWITNKKIGEDQHINEDNHGKEGG